MKIDMTGLHNLNLILNNISNKIKILTIPILVFGLIFLSFNWYQLYVNSAKLEFSDNVKPVSPKKIEPSAIVTNISQELVLSDKNGESITKLVSKLNNKFNMGFISSKNLEDLDIKLPIQFNNQQEILVPRDETLNLKPIERIYPAPVKCEQRNNIVFNAKNILDAPIQYINYGDMFYTNSDGTYDFNRLPEYENHPVYGDINSPAQKKLELGVIHMTAISPLPGEIGNSYFAGHSSNWPHIKSNYNQVFKPLLDEIGNDSVFTIYDHKCRKLDFKVFESKIIESEDIQEAYKSFGGERRIATLQTSVVSYRPIGGWQVYQRKLIRGELVLPAK